MTEKVYKEKRIVKGYRPNQPPWIVYFAIGKKHVININEVNYCLLYTIFTVLTYALCLI